jgi:hypothetical protein
MLWLVGEGGGGRAGSHSIHLTKFTYLGISASTLSKENYLNPDYPAVQKITSPQGHLLSISKINRKSCILGNDRIFAQSACRSSYVIPKPRLSYVRYNKLLSLTIHAHFLCSVRIFILASFTATVRLTSIYY